jgi:hypothetical protein
MHCLGSASIRVAGGVHVRRDWPQGTGQPLQDAARIAPMSIDMLRYQADYLLNVCHVGAGYCRCCCGYPIEYAASGAVSRQVCTRHNLYKCGNTYLPGQQPGKQTP